MKKLDKIKRIISKHNDILLENYGLKIMGIFGSYVRGEQKKKSDIDLLAEIEKPISLFELVGAEIYLSEILEMKVDVVPKEDIREELKEEILKKILYL